MPVIGLAGVGIAPCLRAFDFFGKRFGPFVPGEQSARMQRERHGKSLRFPWFAKHRPIVVIRHAGHRAGGAERSGGVYHAASR